MECEIWTTWAHFLMPWNSPMLAYGWCPSRFLGLLIFWKILSKPLDGFWVNLLHFLSLPMAWLVFSSIYTPWKPFLLQSNRYLGLVSVVGLCSLGPVSQVKCWIPGVLDLKCIGELLESALVASPSSSGKVIRVFCSMWAHCSHGQTKESWGFMFDLVTWILALVVCKGVLALEKFC